MMTCSRFLRNPRTFLLTVVILIGGCITPRGSDTAAPPKDPHVARAAKSGVLPASGTAPRADGPVASGQEVVWTVENPPADPRFVRSGRSLVGPDGTMVVGPYGTCAVAGLTPTQAARQIEAHLKKEMKSPRVLVQVIPSFRTGPATAQSGWRKSSHSFGEIVRASAESGPSSDPDLKPIPPELKTVFPPELKTVFPPITDKKVEEPDLFTTGHHLPIKHACGGHVGGHHGKIPTGMYPVDPSAPSELNPRLLPPYVIGPPDVLLIQSRHALVTHPIQGQHLVRPDGTIGLSIYGSPIVAGLTLDQAKEAIAAVINPKLKLPKDVDEKTGMVTSYYDAEEQLKVIREGLVVDVLAYNSKVYYVITDGGGYGEQVVRVPITGGETVLDAISQVNGLSSVSSRHHVWVARRNPGPGHGGPDSVLRVDWIAVTQHGSMATNYQILPGDRLYVRADRWRTADAVVAKVIAPFERILGVTLLGSQTVNSIRNSNNNNNNNNNR